MKKQVFGLILFFISMNLIAQEKANLYVGLNIGANTSMDYGFFAPEIEVGYQFKGLSFLMPSIGVGTVNWDNMISTGPSTSDSPDAVDFLSANLNLRYVFFKNKMIRFKPYVGARASYTLFLRTENILDQYRGGLITFSPFVGIDYYLSQKFALTIFYSYGYELKTGIEDKITLGFRTSLN
jgi:hypothetical protein